VNEHPGSILDPSNTDVKIYRRTLVTNQEAYDEFVKGLNALVARVHERKAREASQAKDLCACIVTPTAAQCDATTNTLRWHEYRRLMTGQMPGSLAGVYQQCIKRGHDIKAE
jgi:hypothetical protein